MRDRKKQKQKSAKKNRNKTQRPKRGQQKWVKEQENKRVKDGDGLAGERDDQNGLVLQELTVGPETRRDCDPTELVKHTEHWVSH